MVREPAARDHLRHRRSGLSWRNSIMTLHGNRDLASRIHHASRRHGSMAGLVPIHFGNFVVAVQEHDHGTKGHHILGIYENFGKDHDLIARLEVTCGRPVE